MLSTNAHALYIFTVGDFDGDGRMEFIGMNTPSCNYFINSFDGRVNMGATVNSSLDPTMTAPILIPSDFDGDGRSEMNLKYVCNGVRTNVSINIKINGSTTTR